MFGGVLSRCFAAYHALPKSATMSDGLYNRVPIYMTFNDWVLEYDRERITGALGLNQ
jgi:hypothetical protein